LNRAEIFSRQSGMTLAGAAAQTTKPLVLAIGVFDGVHLGHRKLLDTASALSAELNAVPVALTFDPHPRSVLHPAAPVVLLTDLAERVRLLKKYGAELVASVDFTADFAATAPEEFLDMLFENIPQLAGVVVGSQWRFGAGGSGNVQLLEQYAAQHNFVLKAVPELELDGAVVSASSIRNLIAGGRLQAANHLLGRSYALTGTVANGFGIAGSNLNCPTANIVPTAGVLPPDGVYAGIVEVALECYPAAVNIGLAPTYHRSNSQRRIEAHLLDFSGNLYGKQVRLTLGCYLRSEQCFASENALREQIAMDVKNIRSWAENLI